MMTLYYFAHTVAGIVLGLVIIITCLRKLVRRFRIQRPLPKEQPKRILPSARWSAPSRTNGLWWKN